MAQVESSLTRSIVFENIFNRVRDAKAPPNLYLEMAKTQLDTETSEDLLKEQVSRNWPLIVNNYVPAEHLERETEEAFNAIMRMLRA